MYTSMYMYMCTYMYMLSLLVVKAYGYGVPFWLTLVCVPPQKQWTKSRSFEQDTHIQVSFAYGWALWLKAAPNPTLYIRNLCFPCRNLIYNYHFTYVYIHLRVCTPLDWLLERNLCMTYVKLWICRKQWYSTCTLWDTCTCTCTYMYSNCTGIVCTYMYVRCNGDPYKALFIIQMFVRWALCW